MALARVIITPEVFDTCMAHALTTEKEEIMGLLLGDITYDETGSATASIWIAMPQIRTDRRKDRVEASPEQLAEASSTAEAISEASKQRTRVIGWYHSHPHITVLPSHVDVRTQAMYQNLDEGFIGLIFSAFNEDSSKMQKLQVTAFQSMQQGSLGRLPSNVSHGSWAHRNSWDFDPTMAAAISASIAEFCSKKSNMPTERVCKWLQAEYQQNLSRLIELVVSPGLQAIQNLQQQTEWQKDQMTQLRDLLVSNAAVAESATPDSPYASSTLSWSPSRSPRAGMQRQLSSQSSGAAMAAELAQRDALSAQQSFVARSESPLPVDWESWDDEQSRGIPSRDSYSWPKLQQNEPHMSQSPADSISHSQIQRQPGSGGSLRSPSSLVPHSHSPQSGAAIQGSVWLGPHGVQMFPSDASHDSVHGSVTAESAPQQLSQHEFADPGLAHGFPADPWRKDHLTKAVASQSQAERHELDEGAHEGTAGSSGQYTQEQQASYRPHMHHHGYQLPGDLASRANASRFASDATAANQGGSNISFSQAQQQEAFQEASSQAMQQVHRGRSIQPGVATSAEWIRKLPAKYQPNPTNLSTPKLHDGTSAVRAIGSHARLDSFDKLSPEEIAAALIRDGSHSMDNSAIPLGNHGKYQWPEGNTGWDDSPSPSPPPAAGRQSSGNSQLSQDGLGTRQQLGASNPGLIARTDGRTILPSSRALNGAAAKLSHDEQTRLQEKRDDFGLLEELARIRAQSRKGQAKPL